jgi:hypothetical protein
MARHSKDEKIFYGIGALVLLALGFSGVFFGWGKPLAKWWVGNSIKTIQREGERQKAATVKTNAEP